MALKDIRYLQIIAFINHKGLHGLHALQPGYLFGVELQQAETLFEQHHEDQVEPTGDHTHRYHTANAAEFFTLFKRGPWWSA